MKSCAYCGEPQVILTIGGLCLGCEAAGERRVAKLEELLEKGHALRHYESMAAEAAASVPARLGRTAGAVAVGFSPAGPRPEDFRNGDQRERPAGGYGRRLSLKWETPTIEAVVEGASPARLGRTDDTGQRSREAAPVVVSAGGGAP